MSNREGFHSRSSKDEQAATGSSLKSGQVDDMSSDLPSSPDATQGPSSESSTALTPAPGPDAQQLAPVAATPLPQRTPMLIPSTGKKSAGTLGAPQGRRAVIHVGTAVMLLVILVGISAVALQTGDGHANGLLGFFRPQMSSVTKQTNQTALIASQAATATAVMQDGYDAGGNVTYAGVNRDYSLGNGQSTLDINTGGSAGTASAGGKVSAADLVIRATPGQCTYWADYRYWQLTGYEVPWAGNAATYAYQAPSYGWINTTTPVLHSIIVLQPGVENAGVPTGHVGIVEGINADGSVYVSSWNIVGPGILTYSTYTVQPGVSFVYHP